MLQRYSNFWKAGEESVKVARCQSSALEQRPHCSNFDIWFSSSWITTKLILTKIGLQPMTVTSRLPALQSCVKVDIYKRPNLFKLCIYPFAYTITVGMLLMYRRCCGSTSAARNCDGNYFHFCSVRWCPPTFRMSHQILLRWSYIDAIEAFLSSPTVKHGNSPFHKFSFGKTFDTRLQLSIVCTLCVTLCWRTRLPVLYRLQQLFICTKRFV